MAVPSVSRFRDDNTPPDHPQPKVSSHANLTQRCRSWNSSPGRNAPTSFFFFFFQTCKERDYDCQHFDETLSRGPHGRNRRWSRPLFPRRREKAPSQPRAISAPWPLSHFAREPYHSRPSIDFRFRLSQRRGDSSLQLRGSPCRSTYLTAFYPLCLSRSAVRLGGPLRPTNESERPHIRSSDRARGFANKFTAAHINIHDVYTTSGPRSKTNRCAA